MAPPTWKLLLEFEEGSTFSSRQFPPNLCPCRCCWCEKCEVKQLPEELPFPGLPRFYPFEDTTKQPSWSLVLVFAEGSEFPSRPLQSTVGLCRYCWCEKRRSDQIQESDLRAFRSFFSLEATESLKELLEGVTSIDVTDSSLLSSNSYPEHGCNYSSQLDKPISMKELLQQQSERGSNFGDETDSCIEDDQDPTWADVKSEGESDQEATSAPTPNRRNHQSKDQPSIKTFQRTFMCPVCKLTFRGRNPLDEHMKSHDRPYECCLCPARFETRQQKSYHFWNHKDERGQYRCNKCDYTTEHAGNMPLHVRTHSDQRMFQCDQCSMSFRHHHTLRKHTLTHPRKYLFWCMECGQSFPSKNAQRLHLRKHNPIEPFKCIFCAIRFKTKTDLLTHQRTHMEANGSYKCVECNYWARTAKDVIRHMIPAHFRNKRSNRDKTKVAKRKQNTDGEKEQISRSKSKSTKKQLRTSAQPRKRSQQQQYSCSLCASKLITKAQKTFHMKQHKNEDGLYKCRKCDHACKLISEMINHNDNNHKEVEKTYQHACLYCGKSFPEQAHLDLHKKKAHSGKKQYKCYQCSKFFYNSTNLKRHIMVHTGERPYQCSQCMKSFQTSDNFRRHQQTHA